MTTSTESPSYERITCDQVEVGDRIARAKSHPFEKVVHITEGPAARRLFFSYSQESRLPGSRSRHPGKWWGSNIRPQRHAKLWREVCPLCGSPKVEAGENGTCADCGAMVGLPADQAVA